jgi:hypothetical protein
MTPQEFKECLEDINWSQRRLATEIQYNERTVRRFATGVTRIPEHIASWMRTLAKFHRKFAPMYAEIAEFHAQHPAPVNPKKPAERQHSAHPEP